jgi:Flavin containing amine oxidoreductase
MRSGSRVAILGGGVAGLSLAKLLQERGFNDFEVIEKSDRVGGKSVTVESAGLLIEMGTCYTTSAHRHVRRWMSEQGTKGRRLSRTLVDGEDYVRYVRAGAGDALVAQVVRYLHARERLLREASADEASAAVRAEAAMTAAEWLQKKQLPKIERLMYRAMTSLGYGFLDQTSILQAMRWVDVHTIIAGAFHLIEMPESGWGPFWSALADSFSVQTNAQVTSLQRNDTGVRLGFADGTTKTYDWLINTIPLDDLGQIAELSSAETAIRDSVEWDGFATTLLTTDQWFREASIMAYSRAFVPGASKGKLISARHEGFDEIEGRHYYVAGQLPGGYSKAELQEILREDLHRLGVTDANIISTSIWKYFPRYSRACLQESLLSDMQRAQGERRTWHTGATFSHESVANICAFNERLCNRILPALRPAIAKRGLMTAKVGSSHGNPVQETLAG